MPPPPMRLHGVASSSSPSSLSPRHPFVRANSNVDDDEDDYRRASSVAMSSNHNNNNHNDGQTGAGAASATAATASLSSSSSAASSPPSLPQYQPPTTSSSLFSLRPSSRAEVRGAPSAPVDRRDSGSGRSIASTSTSGQHFFEPLLQQLTDVKMPSAPKEKSSLDLENGSNDDGERAAFLYPSASASSSTTGGPSRTSTPFTDAGGGDAVISMDHETSPPSRHHKKVPSWATASASIDGGVAEEDYARPPAPWSSFLSRSKGYHRIETNNSIPSPKTPTAMYPGRPWQQQQHHHQRRFSLAMLKSPRSQLLPHMRRSLETCLTSYHPAKVIAALLFVAAFIASTTLLIIFILNPDKQPKPWRSFCAQQQVFPHAVADSLAPVDVIMGVMTVDSKFDRRSAIRQTYAKHTRPIDPVSGEPLANVQVKFVLGRPRKQFARRIALEMEMYNDIVILDIKENQGAGKTHAWFQWAAENGTVPIVRPASGEGGSHDVAWKRADYVGKADDDAFIVLSELERHLRVAPRKLTYWGYLIKDWFMGGEAYAISADLVDYIATSPVVASHASGKEDTQTARWMRQHPRSHEIHYVSERCYIYDHPKAGTAYSHGYLFPDEVAKIKLEVQRGLPEHVVRARGGATAAQWYSTVSKWHTKWQPRKKDLTIEEELESLVEGGGMYAASGWKNGQPKASVDRHEVFFESDDERLKFPSTRKVSSGVAATSARIMEDWRLSADSHLTIYAPFNDSSPASHRRHDEEDASEIVVDEAASEDEQPVTPALLDHLPLVGALRHLTGGAADRDDPRKRQRVPWAEEHLTASRERSQRLPLPYPATSFPLANGSSIELAELRSQRYLHHGDAARGHMRGGTVVVHYLKRNEWFMETALLLVGKDRLRGDAAGGAWTMWGSPRLP
ncbi:hypothetical protein BDZ90DRAFT_232799 [Jaminaea rosea]|uniref:Glycosyltransferase family 31 protein n=1 Tax=Jaminaea rosea TaxID=1569628 RepID=A0A316UN03_9BASI|nr:hypothetical protein BDZ90DRAFT_232799 [Jaminaea rosea]PWN26667.1 hypothetical protein BDZ90DRAFT_232799 [Jaminaea rosea]